SLPISRETQGLYPQFNILCDGCVNDSVLPPLPSPVLQRRRGNSSAARLCRAALRHSEFIRHSSFVIRHFEFKSSSADPSILSRLPPSPFYWPGFYRWDLRLRA